MKIGIFGTGYVGLVTGACLADLGHQVSCVDTNDERIASLTRGEIPIYEPGLEAIVKRTIREKRLLFSTKAIDAVDDCEAVFVAVGTPSADDGTADLQYVEEVAATIGQLINSYTVIINKSTVPVGTGKLVETIIARELASRMVTIDYDVASNPEFLKEGSAVQDFQRPDRIIVGCDLNKNRAISVLRKIYSPYNRNHKKIMFMDRSSAELTKYAANALLATKITFINQIAGIAEATGADIEQIRLGIGSDKRIGFDFLYAGMGYGGSCFPKDVRALVATAQQHHLDGSLLESVDRLNDGYKRIINDKIYQHYQGQVKGKTLAVWGLTFKANTDDVREAASLELIRWGLNQGMYFRLYDPKGMAEAKKILGDTNIVYCNDRWQCLDDADALAVCTEWQEFKAPDLATMASKIGDKVVFDGRNLYIEEDFAAQSMTCYFVGKQPTNGNLD